MFGNKGFGWKLAGALTLIAVLGVFCNLRAEAVRPSLTRCLAQPARWDGAKLWIPSGTIVSTGRGEYHLSAVHLTLRVEGPAPAAPGTRIGVQGTFRAADRTLVPAHTRVLAAEGPQRGWMEAISVLVAILILANFIRHFMFRPKALQLEGRD